ncbi:MAG: hypothetical protein OXC69_02525 [Candidatus Tectomicrobia bacterium]|nr:hypothetical protein [Candidatus Tectomicrobia bacterium]
MNREQTAPEDSHDAVELYAGGEIKARHGKVNKWLLPVYALLFVWALYYLFGPFEGLTPTFGYWGGLGPGLVGADGESPLGGNGAIAFGIMLAGVVAFFAWVAVLAWRK